MILYSNAIRIQPYNIELLTKASSSRNVQCKGFRKINSFGFGIAFSILFLINKSCFYIVLVDESDLHRDTDVNKKPKSWNWPNIFMEIKNATSTET